MAVIGLAELPQRSGSQGADWKRSYTRKYLVLTDSRYDDAIVVSNGVDPFSGEFIPPLGFRYNNGSPFPGSFQSDLGAFVSQIDCVEVERSHSGSFWEVTVQYSSTDPAAFDAQNPLNSPPRISWGLSRFTSVAEFDINQNAILNSAGDYFDPPLEKDDSRQVLTIVRNEPTYDASMTYVYKDSINEDVFWGLPPGVVKLMDRSAELQHSGDCPINGGYYWEVKYEFEIRPEGWTRYVLDQGLKQLDGGNLVNIVDANGEPISSPMLLNGEGGVGSAGGAVFLPFDVYQPRNFAAFGLMQFGP